MEPRFVRRGGHFVAPRSLKREEKKKERNRDRWQGKGERERESEDVKMWRCEDVKKMKRYEEREREKEREWRCEDEKMRRVWWTCEHMKMYSRPPLLEEPFAQTLSEKQCVWNIRGWIKIQDAGDNKCWSRAVLVKYFATSLADLTVDDGEIYWSGPL